MDNTYIKLFRKIEEWEWYMDIPTKVLFLHLLIKATYTDKKWKWSEIKKWTLITWRQKLSRETGLTVQQIRTALNKLKSTNEITTKSTNDYTVIEIQNWELYQDKSTNEITNEQPTSNQRATTIQESKEGNKERNIVNSNIEISISKEVVKKWPLQEITQAIEEIKSFCREHQIIYDSTDERIFTKHILTAREFWELAEQFKKSRVELALFIIFLAEQDKFWRWKICWPKTIYIQRSKILNSARADYIEKTKNPDVLIC